MSIRKESRKKGTVYVVRVYDPTRKSGYREKTFDRRTDAVAWEAQINLAKRRGTLSELDAGKETFGEFVSKWRTQYASVHLAASTLAAYERYLKNDILPEWERVPLRGIGTMSASEFQAVLLRQGRSPETVRKVLSVLQGILTRAVEWGYIPVNPVRGVRKPRTGRVHVVRVTPAEKVEALCGRLKDRRSTTLVRLLAYAGLRPGEALALTWGDISDTAISVTKAVSLGEIKETKTGASRLVRLEPALRRVLGTDGVGPPDEYVVSGGTTPPSAASYRNWRRRRFKPAADVLGISDRPYDLRHTFASRLFAEGEHPKLVADQMGHTLEVLLSTYVHVMDSEAEQKKATVSRLAKRQETA